MGQGANDQLRAFVDRILRMRVEAKAVADDIREIYAEAKATGFDKTMLGKLVLYIEKREKDPNAVQEQEALFETYLDAYLAQSGTAIATHAHTHETGAEPSPKVEVPSGEAAATVALPAPDTVAPQGSLPGPSPASDGTGSGGRSAVPATAPEPVASPVVTQDTVVSRKGADAVPEPDARTPIQRTMDEVQAQRAAKATPAREIPTLIRGWTPKQPRPAICLDHSCDSYGPDGFMPCQDCLRVARAA